MVEAFGRAGWDIPVPKASMFAWAPLPPALKEMGSLEFSKQLLTHAEVAVAPGVGYGEEGEGFVRIALVENEQRLRQAAHVFLRRLDHHAQADIGGIQPGSMPAFSKHIDEEGAQFVSFKIVKDGVFNEAELTEILMNQKKNNKSNKKQNRENFLLNK